MNHVPLGLLSSLTLPMLEAIGDLEHECDLISTRPTAQEVSWALQRAGAPVPLCAAVLANGQIAKLMDQR